MNNFLTWQALTTQAGSLLATMTVTELLKDIGLLRRLPTRLLSFFVSLVLLLLATAFTSGLTVSRALIAPVNAAVTALACNGTYDALVKKAKLGTSASETKENPE